MSSCSVYTSVYTSEVMCVCAWETSLTLSFSWLMSPFRACKTLSDWFKAVPKNARLADLKKLNKTKDRPQLASSLRWRVFVFVCVCICELGGVGPLNHGF